ncbi:F-box domain-containing protein [Hirschfeldia incana]|nr:F-box domain-containing protein [Hirschfeldia incana]
MNPASFSTDITTDIFARLPAKSAAKCRTLSKQWSSILRSPDFASLFLTHSSTRPRLLFAVERNALWTFFTSPQPHPHSSPSHSPVVTAEFHTKFSGDVSQYLCSYASGLILFPDMWIPNKSDDTNPVVCNPVTGKYEALPYLSIYRKSRAFLGFDHVGKQFKVLSEDRPFCNQSDHHQVLSLGDGGGEEELSWRVKDGPQYSHCVSEAIQIGGALYYLADNFNDLPLVVRFDVRSEEFEFIEADCLPGEEAVKLIDYKGKLAGVNWKYVKVGDDDGKIVLELSVWVLEDVEMKQWVKSVYFLSEEKIVRRCNFSVAGMTKGGEIVLAMDYTAKVYHVFFFDPEKSTLRSVQVEGFGDRLEAIGTRGKVHVFVDYVEDLNVHDGKQLKSSILKERGESKQSSSAQIKELVGGVE